MAAQRALRAITTLVVAGLLLVSARPAAAVGCYDYAGQLYRIDPSLLQAIARTESGENPRAVNYANSNGSYDYGLMQINTVWYKTLGQQRWNALADPCYSTVVGAWILSQCFASFGVNEQGLGCYNAGWKKSNVRDELRRKYAQKVLKNLQKLKPAERSRNVQPTPHEEGQIASATGRPGSAM